ncbi:MAG: CHAP domain-containing protein [Sphingobium sp.]|nr:CHAP domain-containing protein [Sphingobium sp.]
MFGLICRAAGTLLGLTYASSLGAATLQCVPYARIVSGVEIYGDAWTWWDQADTRYQRGNVPKKGAVLAFRPNGPMALGHVAVVSKILGKRRVLIRHANWSQPGAIEEDVLAVDVSDAGDWSEVRVWHSPSDKMGVRVNPVFGFIYSAKGKLHPFTPRPELGDSTQFVRMDTERWSDVMAPNKPADSRKTDKKQTASSGVQKQAGLSVSMRDRKSSRLILALADMEGPAARPAGRGPKNRLRLDLSEERQVSRSLGDIIADVKRGAKLR